MPACYLVQKASGKRQGSYGVVFKCLPTDLLRTSFPEMLGAAGEHFALKMMLNVFDPEGSKIPFMAREYKMEYMVCVRAVLCDL